MDTSVRPGQTGPIPVRFHSYSTACPAPGCLLHKFRSFHIDLLHGHSFFNLGHFGRVQAGVPFYPGIRQVSVHTVNLRQIMAAAFGTDVHVQFLVSAIVAVGQ